MHFDERYAEDVQLADGSAVRLRLVRANDKPLLEAGFAKLSPEARFSRFFTDKATLTAAELTYLTEMDQAQHFALGALTTDEGGAAVEGLGVARFVRLADRPAVAEAAVAVADRATGRGLGRMLLERLIAAAVERGVERFRFEVLAANDAMRGLLAEMAPGAEVREEEGHVVLEWPLPAASVGVPGEADESPFYRLLAMAEEGAVVVRKWLFGSVKGE